VPATAVWMVVPAVAVGTTLMFLPVVPPDSLTFEYVAIIFP